MKFNLVTSESYPDKEGNLKTETDWHSIIAWQKLAFFIENYLHKGCRVYLEEKIKNRSYEDKNGIKKKVTEIIAENILMLDKKPTDKADINVTTINKRKNCVYTDVRRHFKKTRQQTKI